MTLEFVETQGPVVQGRGQAEAVVHQVFLARPVALEHAAHLGHGDVGFVDEHQALGGR
jgi:hypothetical protein